MSYLTEYQKIGILQTECLSHMSTLTKFKEAGVTPNGLSMTIPCIVKSLNAETKQRWEQVLKNTSHQLIEVLLNHYSSANAECEEKLTMLHMETLNSLQDEHDESK